MSTLISSVSNDDCVIADRGGIIENRHNIHAAVVSASGTLLYSVGDASRVVLIRSAAKPAQAVAIIEGCGDKYDFSDEDVALMCASHNSEERHLERARSMLAKTGTCESQLRCGGHPSIDPDLNRAWIRADFTPTPICNNCSGKHIGMLAGAKALEGDAGIEGYHLLEHPMQQRVRRTVEELCGLDEQQVAWGIDGCNLPAPAVPLRAMGRMYASLAAAAYEERDAGDDDGRQFEDEKRKSILARIYRCMASYPSLVAGERRFCTVLMHAFRGQLIGKVGADGCYGLSILPSKVTEERFGTREAIGIGVKVEDGNLDILYSTVAEILEQLQVGTPEMRLALEPFHRTKRLNTMNVVIGHVSFLFKVRKVPSGHGVREEERRRSPVPSHFHG